LAAIFVLELLNGLVHHAVRQVEESRSIGPIDLAATLTLFLLLASIGAIGAGPARRFSSAAIWSSGLWCFAMITSYLIMALADDSKTAALQPLSVLMVTVVLLPVAIGFGCLGVFVVRRIS
jgi:hypothetical protein